MSSLQSQLAVIGFAATVGAVVFHKSMQRQLIAAYPDRDSKLVKKAFNMMMRDALAGKLIGVDLTDEFLDAFFNVKYNKLINQK